MRNLIQLINAGESALLGAVAHDFFGAARADSLDRPEMNCTGGIQVELSCSHGPTLGCSFFSSTKVRRGFRCLYQPRRNRFVPPKASPPRLRPLSVRSGRTYRNLWGGGE